MDVILLVVVVASFYAVKLHMCADLLRLGKLI